MREEIMAGTAIEDISAGSIVVGVVNSAGDVLLKEYRAPEKEIPTHVLLTQEAVKAGLVVTQLMPQRGLQRGEYYVVQIWAPDGTLWAEGSGESAESVRRIIETWKNRD